MVTHYHLHIRSNLVSIIRLLRELLKLCIKIWPSDEKWMYPTSGGTAFVGSNIEKPIGYLPKLVIDTSALHKTIEIEQKRLGSSFTWWSHIWIP